MKYILNIYLLKFIYINYKIILSSNTKNNLDANKVENTKTSKKPKLLLRRRKKLYFSHRSTENTQQSSREKRSYGKKHKGGIIN